MANFSIITVTFNNEETIEDFLKSIKEGEVIVVDNNSTDKTIEKIKRHKVTLIENKINLGFGKASNLAARKASKDYLFFINPDTKIKGNVSDLASYLKENPNVGVVSAKLIQPDGQTQNSVRKLPSIRGAIKEYYFKVRGSYEPFFPKGVTPAEVEGVYGAAIMISRKLFEELGGFDEKFFMYYEDLDLCRRVQNRGLKIVYFPGVEIVHRVGHSKSEMKSKWLRQSAAKYHGFVKYILLDLLLRFRPR